MIGFLISFLVLALVLYIVWWVIGLALQSFNPPPHVHQIIGGILILILLAWLLHGFGLLNFSQPWRIRVDGW